MSEMTFRDLLDAAIIEGQGSGEIGKAFGINSVTVRRRRTELRRAGVHVPRTIEEQKHARRSKARCDNGTN